MRFLSRFCVLLLGISILATLPSGCRLAGNGPQSSLLDSNSQNSSAWDVWSRLERSIATQETLPIYVNGTQTMITFGAEKEGSTSEITRVFGPTSEDFYKYVLKNTDPQVFLANFLQKWADGSYRADTVVDMNDQNRAIDPKPFQRTDFGSLDSRTLDERFKAWLAQTGDKPLAHIRPYHREELFEGELLGQIKPMDPQELAANNQYMQFKRWVPHYGLAETYLAALTTDEGGIWEILFKPQNTYGEFEKMVTWFRNELAYGSGATRQLFEAPGHQRIVFSSHPSTSQEVLSRLKEVMRVSQAYIILKEMGGGTGVDVSLWKRVFPDSMIEQWTDDRGVIRLETDRFKVPGSNDRTLSLEQRAGTKTDETRRAVHKWVVTYAASQDFHNIVPIEQWTLLEGGPKQGNLTHMNPGTLAQRFGIDHQIASLAVSKIRAAEGEFADDTRKIKKGFEIPLWFWENAPFTQGKKDVLRKITSDFIRQVASSDGQLDTIRKLMQDWALATEIDRDIEQYLTPKRFPSNSGNIQKLLTVPSGPRINVNDIDLGIEYSARFPLDTMLVSTHDYFLGRKDWLRTRIDLTPQERANILSKVAQGIQRKLGGSQGKVTDLRNSTASDHGHGLDLAFEFTDGKNRTWRVEWDGINRAYTPDGQIIPESIRGGHVEIVTPKFVPTATELQAVMDAMGENNLYANSHAGGGHINIDLSVFENKPREFARFLALFHEHRGAMSFLFQSANRLRAAEPVELSPAFASQLADFSGNETQLKQALYNEHYFNTRMGRKAKYLQLDVAAYFQDVIPAEFIHQDFDISNPRVLWRPNFDVNPNIRKGELRLFDAPRDAVESALQIRLVRALVHQALNSDAPISGRIQEVNHERYAQDINLAKANFMELMNKLGLSPADYEPYFYERINQMRTDMLSSYYTPLAKKLAGYPKTNAWGQALRSPRSPAQALSSQNRPWGNSSAGSSAISSPQKGTANAGNTGTTIDELREEKIRRAELLEQRRKKLQEQIERGEIPPGCDGLRRILDEAFHRPVTTHLLLAA